MDRINDHIDWNDDDRHPTVRSIRSMKRSTSPDVSLGHVCREIACDVETQKRKLLWNEVEFVNYTYEFASSHEDVYNLSEAKTTGVDEAPTKTEVNPECYDGLVKNQTAYL